MHQSSRMGHSSKMCMEEEEVSSYCQQEVVFMMSQILQVISFTVSITELMQSSHQNLAAIQLTCNTILLN